MYVYKSSSDTTCFAGLALPTWVRKETRSDRALKTTAVSPCARSNLVLTSKHGLGLQFSRPLCALTHDSQAERYKQLLMKQRDIMIALTQRLNERDDAVSVRRLRSAPAHLVAAAVVAHRGLPLPPREYTVVE